MDAAAGTLVFLSVSLGIAMVVVAIIGWCKMFKKAGLHPGFYFIPGYGWFLQYKMADSVGLFIATMVLAGVMEVVSFAVNLSAAGMASRYSRSGYYGGSSWAPGAGLLVFIGIAMAAALVLQIVYMVRLARSFGKGGGFAVGLIFLTPIFIAILGFGDAVYQGPEMRRRQIPEVPSDGGEY